MSHETAAVHLPLTLRLSKEAQETLSARAQASGADLESYVSAIVEQSAQHSLSLEDLSGPVYRRFLESGVSDEQLSEELEAAKHELRSERRSRKAS